MKSSASRTLIEVRRNGAWRPLKNANETPVFPCRIESVTDLLASAWLSLHIDDDSDYDETNRVQKITPYYVNEGEEPVLLLTRNGVMVEQPLAVGVPFLADLLAPHALLPRKWADQVLAHGHDNFPAFLKWWGPLYDNEDVAPMLAWRTADA
jgi:hypothetical protein